MSSNQNSNPAFWSRLSEGKGLSVRLVMTTLIYAFVISFLVIGIQLYFVYTQAVESSNRVYTTVESEILPSLTNSLWQNDDSQVNLILDAIAKQPNISSVSLTDESGKHWTKQKPSQHLLSQREFPLVYHENNTAFYVGLLHLEITRDDIINQTKERMIRRTASSFMSLFLGALLALFLFQRWITRHLEKMANFTENMDLQNLHQELILDKAPNRKPDELDIVVNAINRLLKTLQKDLALREVVEDDLLLHKKNLEAMIAERTRELEYKTQQLEEKTQLLETQNRELDAYAHSVAHDLKTPLTTLIGMSSLLTSNTIAFSPEQIKTSLQAINRTAIKMNSIIDALLLLASIRRESEVSITRLDILKIAQEASVRLNSLAEQKNAYVALVGDWQDAMGYAPWLEEVWVNFLSNAMKYGGSPPQIEMGCTPAEHGFLKFWVRDHGEGIEKEQANMLFTQFTRLAPHKSEGHGLGLSITKRIIERLHGEVGYEPTEGGGSCFWFTLPAATKEQ